MRKKFKLSLTMATLAEINANDAMVGTSKSEFRGSLKSSGFFVFVRLAGIWLQSP
jgi:hypothetical protein